MSIHSSPPIDAVLPAARASWMWHLGALVAVTAATLAIFSDEVINAVQVWWIYPAYSHCFLIIPVALWLIWERREGLARISPSVAPLGLLVLPAMLFLWAAGYFASINEARQFAVVGIFETIILVLLGPRVFQAIAFPLLYLFFMVPFGQYLIPPMQQFAAAFTDQGLSLLGIVHYTEGTIIELPNARFEIAEACAGLRFLIATVALGVLFVHLAYRRWWKIVAFLAACVIVPLIANGLRCVGILALAYVTNDAAAVEADHVVYGLGFNIAILAILLFGGLWFRDTSQSARVKSVRASECKSEPMRIAVAAITAIAIVGIVPAFAHWRDGQTEGAGSRVIARPNLPHWTATGSSPNWHPDYIAPDRKLEAAVTSDAGAGKVDIAVWYYSRLRPGRSLVDGLNHVWNEPEWHSAGFAFIDGQIGAIPVRFNENILSSTGGDRVVWSCYWIDGRFTTSATMVKLRQLKALVLGGKGAALIAFSALADSDLDKSREKIRSAAAAFVNLPYALNGGLSETAFTAEN